MPRPMLLNGETVDAEYVESSEIDTLRQEFANFAASVQSKFSELRHDIDAITKGILVASGELSGKPVVTSNGTDTGAKWEQIKSRLAPRLREAIDVLQVQGPMSGTQLAYAMRMDRSNCSKNVVAVLQRQGLIVRHGNNISLKPI